MRKQKDDFKNIPSKVISYCSQNCSNYPTHTEHILIEDLTKYSTACGSTPNHSFDSKVITFLKKNSGKDFVIAEVYDYSEEMKEDFENEKVIVNMSIFWKDKRETQIKNTNKFSEMVSENEGSLRPEEIFYEGWDCYESE